MSTEGKLPFWRSESWWKDVSEGGGEVLESVFGQAARSGRAAGVEFGGYLKRMVLAERQLREIELVLERPHLGDDEVVASIRKLVAESKSDEG